MEVFDRRTRSDTFQDSPHLLAVVALDGTFKVVNETWSRALGYRPEDLIGHHLSSLVDDQDRAKVLKLINPRLVESEPGPFDLTLKCKDRSYRAFEWERRRVAAEDAMFIAGKDVTDKKRLEITGNLQQYELEAQARESRLPK